MASQENNTQDSQNQCQNSESETQYKDVYFLILRPSEEKVDFTGLNYKTENKIKPSIVHKKKIDKEDGTFLEEIVFKFRKKEKKKKNEKNESSKSYAIKFYENEHTYNIKFSLKNESFIYQPKLTTGNKYLDIIEEPIEQNLVPLYNKLNIFLEALKTNNESELDSKLYEDTINLYTKKKQFSLLVTLFLKIYENNKDLCKDLIKEFYDINHEDNDDRLIDLKKDLKSFKDIYSNSSDILEKYGYNPIHFYGILFSYLHYYDKTNFPKMIEEFSKGNSDTLYEILIKYNSHFMNPLKQNQEFYNKFIKYVLKKELPKDIFKRALNYIDDIETFLFAINSNKEDIFKSYDDLKQIPIKMTASLKLKKHKIDKAKKLGSDNNKDKESSGEESDNPEEDKTKGLDSVNNIENECDSIVRLIEQIIGFSKNEKILLIYIKSTFWINLINEYNIPDWENIDNIHKLRELYKKYNQLVKELYDEEKTNIPKKEKERINDIKTDINSYYKRDEFAFMLDKNIKDFFEESKNKLTNAEILATISKYNPYFSIRDKNDKEKYKNNRETYIFDYVNFNKITKVFIDNFQNFNFELMFEEKIGEYLNKITGKITNIQTFGNIMKLIKVERIKEEKQKDYFRILENKYKLIKNDIKSLNDDNELKKSIKIIAEFVSKLFLFENNNRFLKDEISTLDEKIKSLVYIELITKYSGKEYEEQKNCIYDIYLGKLETKEGRDDIIKLVKNLKGDDRDYFIYEKLLEKCQFEREDFFSNQENYQIQTLCLLNEELKKESLEEDKKKEEQNNEGKNIKKEIKLDILSRQENENDQQKQNARRLQTTLDNIKEELDQGTITKKELETFLNIKKVKNKESKSKEKDSKEIEEIKNEENINDVKIKESKDKSSQYVRDKLELITLVIANYDPITKYSQYVSSIDKINESVEKLEFIKESLMVFHRNKFNDEIKNIVKVLEEIENSSIQKFNSEETRKAIEGLLTLNSLCELITIVKDFLLFKKIFENAQGSDQAERFDDARNKLQELKEKFGTNLKIETIFNDEKFANTFKNIKEELGRKTEIKSKEFIDQMIKYFNIEDKAAQLDLKIIINSKKHENVVKSIKYFFDNFLDKKLLDLPDNINLSDMNLITLKRTLSDLKKKGIYDYVSITSNYDVFTAFYEKKQAIDFLISKIDSDAKEFSQKLKDKLDPTNRSISIKDIDDTIKCLKVFQDFKKLDALAILNYITLLQQDQIKIFKSYSKKFGSIIELNERKEEDRFEKVYDIIQDSSLLFNLDNEDFLYNKNGKFIKIDIEELIKLKNKINIQPQKIAKENGDKIKESKKTGETKEEQPEKEEITKKDIFETKCDKLLFFKNTISNLEIIHEKMNILTKKGFNIPLVINITIKYPNIIYKLNDKEKKFDKIKDYLFTLKTDFEKQLDTIYENEKYLRLIYGKLFRKAMQHQGGNCEISEMVRYILNKSGNNDKIQDGELNNITLGEDFEDQFHYYSKIIFDGISRYMTSLFSNNDLDLNKHYEQMKILDKFKNKGIFIKKCEKKSMEEYILGLFMEKLDKLPIAQNILICSKDTSIEEIQSFFSRAILCDNNTLFAVEILESFSNYQHNKMYSFIDILLSIKFEKYKKINKDNKKKKVEKSNSNEYLDSFIVLVYKKLENEDAFRNELGKYIGKNQKDNDPNENPLLYKESKDIATNAINKEKEKDLRDVNISDIPKDNSIQEDELSQSKIIISPKYEITRNIKVISSDVCGLGKSFRIKKLIKKENKIYYHFPLGGKLTKNDIYTKIIELFKKIKIEAKEKKAENKKSSYENNKDINNEEYSEFNNVAIHLDLIETKETSLINEFLFSFLITKFYNSEENIIYIPNNIKIYIEVPNSFENYFSKFGILNAFKIENIVLEELNPNEKDSEENIENVSMLPLELDKNTRMQFTNLNGFKEDREIEKFIKDNFNSIGIKKYSYHQVETFIKLYISQFNSFNQKRQKLTFTDNGKDITKECIEDFSKSTKYFTNGGFAKLIFQKKHIKNIYDLCLDAYESDLINIKFDTPLIFIDEKTMKCKFEKLPDISEEKDKIIKANKNKDVDIVYLIDGTGSMSGEITAAKVNVIKIFENLTKNYKEYNFQFGAVFYRDKIDSKKDKYEYFQFTKDMQDLQKKIGTIKAYGGGDTPEDWVGGYEIALKSMQWRNGIKLIIHIADAGGHGEEFSKNDKHDEQGALLYPIIEECVKKNIKIIGFKIGNTPKQSFEKICEIYDNYRLKYQDNGQFIEIFEFQRDEKNQEVISKNFKKLVIQAANQAINPSYKYLKRLKQILYLPNDIEDDKDGFKSLLSILKEGSTDNYVITEDNYKKMILLIYRIKANIPVIIMGETGCGKTSLIKKLSQLLNNGDEVVEVINISPAITDKEIIEKMIKMNNKAKTENYKGKELWVFFDEINTCLSLSLLTEIFINRTYNGVKLEGNIRLMGACNPYRKRGELIERCGLTREDDEDDQLVYKVEQLPQSLLYYVFSFGSLRDEDEKKYIRSITQVLFDTNDDKLHDLTTEAISQCHIFLRENFGNDPSIVSLREIARFKTSVEFFMDYFIKKKEKLDEDEKREKKKNQNEDEKQEKKKLDEDTRKLYKIKSIICSIYLCYYIRLTNDERRGKRGLFDAKLQKILLNIANVYCVDKEEDTKGDLLSKIRYEKLSLDLRGKKFIKFSDLLKFEEEFLLDQIELDKGIGKNQLLKENLFLLFLAVVTKMPLIIVGKPGTGKSLSAQLILNSMKGKYSKPKGGKDSFFLKYPQIIQKYFQGSESTSPEDVEELFKQTEEIYTIYKTHNSNAKKNDIPIYMILFDELGLAEKSSTNPLKILHNRLEYGGKTEGTCFVGISNYSLDAAKVNRALNLSVPNLEDQFDQLKSTTKSIVDSISEDISEDINKDILIFNILAKSYSLYKEKLSFIKKLTVLKHFAKNKNLKGKNFKEIEREIEYIKILKKDKKIKTEFHGNRDFYSIIKGVAIEGSRLNNINDEKQIVPIINNFIERNFGGICYDIDIDFNLEFEDIKEDINILKNEILNEKLVQQKEKNHDEDEDDKKDKEENMIKITSVYLFKKIYNLACNEKFEGANNENGKIYKIGNDDLNKYELNKRINDNINDNHSRYLLLEIKSNIAPLINQIIRAQNPERKDNIDSIIGSPFSDDNNSDYKTKKINEIQNGASQETKLLILQNLDKIQAYLYDLYNMNYKIIDDQKFVRICLENFSEQLTPVADSFKIIVLVDNKFVDKVDMAFLNRLEKMQISFKDLLDKKQKELIKDIREKIRLKKEIKEEESYFNYYLNNLLINCDKQDIGGLVYYLFLGANTKNINEEYKVYIKDTIYTKISNLLPQDIAIILKEDNPIKIKYNEKKKYYNFNQYLKALNSGDKNLSKYKISIIYTFSNIVNTIEGYRNENEFMISAVNTEENLKTFIDDIKAKNKVENKKQPILIRFEDFNSNKIQFTADYITNYCKNDDYHYIFIIYIHRTFISEKEQRIYWIPNIYDNINQLFIDNLKGPEITLKNLITKTVKDIMLKEEVFTDLDKEFKEALIDFIYDGMKEKNKIELERNSKMSDLSTYLSEKYGNQNQSNEEKYSEDIIKYMLYIDQDFKNSIIAKAKELIDVDKDAQNDCYSLVKQMLKENYINKNKIDIISCVLDYIKEKVFSKYLRLIFNVLEDNNFLTTLLEINNKKIYKLDKNDRGGRPNNNKIIKELEKKFINEIKVDNSIKYKPKFLYNYIVPGFYNFYKNFSIYLINDIASEFLNNEKHLRNYEIDQIKELNDFHDKEEDILKKVIEKIRNDKLYSDLINRITPDLILNDYIIFYLEKNLGIYSKPFDNIISLLLNLRFSDERNIIKNNIDNELYIVIIKIIWIESNIDYIKGIIQAFELGKNIINDNEGSLFNKKIFDVINDKKNPIKYIANKDRPEYMKEVNECFYLFLAGLCLSITSNDMEKMNLSIGSYCGILKDIYKIIKYLDSDLLTYLNELYIIDELIKIMEYNPNTKKSFIEEIRDNLVENILIIQKNQPNKNTKLIENFNSLNELLQKIKNIETKDKYYETLKYVYKKEIEKINDNVYCSSILEEIIKEKEIIKISNDIFQILLKKYTDANILYNLLDSKDNIIVLLNKKLSDESKDYYIALSETLLYFFESNSLRYLKDFLDEGSFSIKKDKKNEKKEDEEGPLDIFKECIKFLIELINNKINEGLTYITQLYCIGYIKTFCYTFIQMHDNKEYNPDDVIKMINKYDKTNMVKLYVYKIIYNKNNKQINVFLNSDIKKKYKLNKYNEFNDFIKAEEIEKLEQFSYGDNKSNTLKILKEYEENHFENEINKDDISSKKKDFDDFYMAANKLILSKLKYDKFENDESYNNFYPNVCEPLYKKEDDEEDDDSNKLINLMKYLFNKETYEDIKKDYEINSEDIDVLLYGYRYVLNEVKGKEGDYIYSYLYNRNNLRDFDKKFYPGNDNNNKDEPYYDLYNKIVNHFKEKPNEGCYVCLCDKGYYHSVSGGFPGFSEINMKCSKCGKEIGAIKKYTKEIIEEKDGKKKEIDIEVYETVKNNSHYYRIFKNNKEINDLKIMKEHYKNFQKMKYMTVEEFKKEYIKPLYSKEKGLNKIDINDFKKENKIIRNLSQISYRLLNYILYCNLFFAKLYTSSEKFDNYLPEGMKWFTMIKECFNILKEELKNKNIKYIDIFMNFVFKDLFNKLHNKGCINNYEDLIVFEDELEELIKEKCEKVKEEIDKYKRLEKESIEDEKSAIALIKEIYDENKYKNNKDFNYYKYFYYTDYLDEDYIYNIIKDKNENDYPMLFKYLKNKRKKQLKENDKYSLYDLSLFNKVLKIFDDKYSNKISREFAEKKLVKDSDIYQDKKKLGLIEDFINLYNGFECEYEGEKLILNAEKNYISDFLLIDDNKYGKSYIEIYKEYINKQNKELEILLDKKIDSGEFNINCKNKINVQQLKESEIFNLPKKSKEIFNSSYRKYIDTQKHENYNEYEIRFGQIEEGLTNSYLKNKRLLNDELKRFNFNNEVFTYEITDLISNFTYDKMAINIDDKEIIYKFIKENENNKELYKTIINNFITLIEHLNTVSKDENNKINLNTKICEIEIVKNLKNISKEFRGLFQDEQDENQKDNNKDKQLEKKISNINLTVSKIVNIFDYFLMLIFKYVKSDIEKYQEKNKEENTIYNKLDFNNMDIKKDDLAYALRIFITLVLFREKDKGNKIKINKKNIIDYLNNKDLWKSSLYNNPSKFELDLSKIKRLNIKIQEILFFYYYLIDKKDEGFENEVVNYIKKKKEEAEEQKHMQNILEKGDKSNDDSDDERQKKGYNKSKNSDDDSDDESQKKGYRKRKNSDDDSDDERRKGYRKRKNSDDDSDNERRKGYRKRKNSDDDE